MLRKATREVLEKITIKDANYLVSRLGKILNSGIYYPSWNKDAIQKNYEKCWDILSQYDD